MWACAFLAILSFLTARTPGTREQPSSKRQYTFGTVEAWCLDSAASLGLDLRFGASAQASLLANAGL
jgi:hypothetical protein